MTMPKGNNSIMFIFRDSSEFKSQLTIICNEP
jgi:hypothetical protein